MLAMVCFGASASAAEFIVKPIIIDDLKAVFGSVASKNLQPARARIGGTLISISVEEGSTVIAGQTVAVIADDKLTLKLDAVDANISALSASHANALRELERGQSLFEKGLTSKARIDQLQTQADVLTNQVKASKAERFVIVQQIEEGKVLSPSTGRVLSVPQTRGAVVLPGEAIATIAGGGYFLRLALPERHAAFISEGNTVIVGKRGLSASPDEKRRMGKVVKVYPKLENGRVIVDAEVPGLDDFFIGERILVWIPVDKRRVLAVPPEAITTRSGIDYVTISTTSGESEIAVIPGQTINTKDGPRTEILSGISFGDKVMLP
ncbi:MAG: efflux transporter periplasmic adaptor subunit [Hyphomicrobiales bacterium]|nr:MAG: efflux transporter periplasmic adaptor subunit [Hyphomicrobiales bacterium]